MQNQQKYWGVNHPSESRNKGDISKRESSEVHAGTERNKTRTSGRESRVNMHVKGASSKIQWHGRESHQREAVQWRPGRNACTVTSGAIWRLLVLWSKRSRSSIKVIYTLTDHFASGVVNGVFRSFQFPPFLLYSFILSLFLYVFPLAYIRRVWSSLVPGRLTARNDADGRRMTLSLIFCTSLDTFMCHIPFHVTPAWHLLMTRFPDTFNLSQRRSWKIQVFSNGKQNLTRL